PEPATRRDTHLRGSAKRSGQEYKRVISIVSPLVKQGHLCALVDCADLVRDSLEQFTRATAVFECAARIVEISVGLSHQHLDAPLQAYVAGDFTVVRESFQALDCWFWMIFPHEARGQSIPGVGGLSLGASVLKSQNGTLVERCRVRGLAVSLNQGPVRLFK